MIRVGSFGMWPRPRGLSKRIPGYARVRRARPRKRRDGERDSAPVILSGVEFPTATLAHRAARYLLLDWLRARAAWVRPRTIPLVVAFAGMCGVLASMHYLTKAPPPAAVLRIDVGAPGATIHLDRAIPRTPIVVDLRTGP